MSEMRAGFVLFVILLSFVIPASAVIGPYAPVTDPAGYGPAYGKKARAASNGRGYLAIWSNGNTHGSRLDEFGRPLDIQPLSFIDIAGTAVVASNGTDYLVAGGDTYSGRIFVYHVSAATGKVTQTFSGAGSRPALVRVGSLYLMAWLPAASFDIAFVTFDGSGKQVAEGHARTTGYASYALAASGSDVSIFWRERTGVPHAAALTREGDTFSLPAATTIDAWIDTVAAVSDGDRWLMTYRHDAELRAQLFARDLKPLGEPMKIESLERVEFDAPVVVVSKGKGFLIYLTAAYTNDTLVVAIDDTPAAFRRAAIGTGVEAAVVDGTKLFLLVVSRSSSHVRSIVTDTSMPITYGPLDGTPVSLGPIVAARPAIASNGGAFALAWEADTSIDGEVLVRMFDAAGKPRGPQFSLGAGTRPVIAADGAGGYLVAWVRPIAQSYDFEPSFVTIAPDGTVSPAVVPSTERSSWAISAVRAGDHYVLAWQSAKDRRRNSVAVRVSGEGQLIDAVPIALSAGTVSSAYESVSEQPPLLAVTDTGIVLAVPRFVYDERAQTSSVYTALLSYDLDRMRPLERTALEATEPQLASAGNAVLLTFKGAGGKSRFVRFTAAGMPLDDAIGRLLPIFNPYQVAAWMNDRWLLTTFNRLSFMDAGGELTGDEKIGYPEIDAIAPAAADSAWYVQKCPGSPQTQLCVGRLWFGAPRLQRRAGH